MRYSTGALAYFAQGIPMGLLHIALPAWLAVEGVAASQIATFLGIIMLPWAFKLIAGPLMDHFEYLPMGKKRPWVIGMQLGMVLSLLALMWVDDPVQQFGLLTALGFLINTFTAAQDVAVDGMSIDLVPVEEEGRLNAFMSFGKSVGWAITSAVTGSLLVIYGMKITAIVCAVGAAAIFIFLVIVRERHNERLFPWSKGEASPKNEEPPSFRQVFSDINHVLWTRASIIIMLIMFIDGLVGGYGRALMPIAAIQVFNFTTPQWADLNAVMGLAGAVIALGLGPIIDRFGAKTILGLTIFLTGIHAFTLAGTQEMWSNDSYVLVMMSLWILLLPVIMVCALALAMSICSAAESATQFAIYMSVSNLGATAGSLFYGSVADVTSWSQNYALKGLLVFLLLLSILMFRSHGHPEEVLED
ncbi:MAG: MFS transporter [Xanthomonadales bacterium]|nr:MFS transporter [Gammaproteobacteria bacterium]MBT8054441.1 MFS transporter [Gammaproteobacteria bacterium]NND58455.1 MFS transporter [Xanthomonadales bacterium]NNK50124.1 MFS transporter [Xanthomonadales bacterium]